jgi:hypothetical protein
VTPSGRTCQAWDQQSPHEHKRTAANYPTAGLVGNFCRNPDGEKNIWCYTTDPEKRWEYCTPVGAAKEVDPLMGAKYLGCFRDKRERDLETRLKEGSNTYEACFKAAAEKGFRFAGLQNGSDCWASNSENRKYG